MSTDSRPDAAPIHPDQASQGMAKGLTNYGDRGFSLFLRKAFIKGAGYTDQAHLCRETRRVTGFSPDELYRRMCDQLARVTFRKMEVLGF